MDTYTLFLTKSGDLYVDKVDEIYKSIGYDVDNLKSQFADKQIDSGRSNNKENWKLKWVSVSPDGQTLLVCRNDLIYLADVTTIYSEKETSKL